MIIDVKLSLLVLFIAFPKSGLTAAFVYAYTACIKLFQAKSGKNTKSPVAKWGLGNQ